MRLLGIAHIVCWIFGHKPCDCVNNPIAGLIAGFGAPSLHCRRCGMVKY